MHELDVRGLSCPEPVMLTEKTLNEHKNEEIKILTDEAHSKSNIEKFLKGKGLNPQINNVKDGYEIIVK